MKTKRKLTAILLAAAMMFSFSACDTGGEDNKTGTNANDPDAVQEAPDDDGREYYSKDDGFDFGVIVFNEREFVIPMGGELNFGDNIEGNHDAEDVTMLTFFKADEIHGYLEEDGPEEMAELEEKLATLEEGTDEYEKVVKDINKIKVKTERFEGLKARGFADNADHGLLISQNGDFWENISKIEASFSFEGICDIVKPEDIGFIQEYIQGGGLSNWKWWNGSENFIENYLNDNDAESYVWGDTMTVTWDIDKFKEEHGSTADGEYVFGEKPKMATVISSGKEIEEERGGGLIKFGLQIGSDEFDDITVKINWDDVKIYVRDLDKFYDYVDQVAEIRGQGMSESAKGKVFKVD